MKKRIISGMLDLLVVGGMHAQEEIVNKNWNKFRFRISNLILALVLGIFSSCDSESDSIKPDDNVKEPLCSWIGAVWSYVEWEPSHNYTDGHEEKDSIINYIRYTVLDEPEEINGKVYYPLVKYVNAEYSPEVVEATYRIRQEGQRIYMLKKDFKPKYGETRFLTSGKDYLLYDFGLEVGEKYCKVNNADGGNSTVRIEDISTVTTMDGFTFRSFIISPDHSIGDERIIDGIGSVYDLLNPCILGRDFNIIVSRNHGYTLNYFRSADGSIVYKNTLEYPTYWLTTFVPSDNVIE